MVKSLDAGLAAYFHKQRKHVKVGTSWQEFFELVDEDRSGRLTFDELASSVELNARTSRYDLSLLRQGRQRFVEVTEGVHDLN